MVHMTQYDDDRLANCQFRSRLICIIVLPYTEHWPLNLRWAFYIRTRRFTRRSVRMVVIKQPTVFDELAKPIREALEERGFVSPTDPQMKAIPEILAGKNVLLISPTASGKTEAAVLPVLSMYITNRAEEPGIKILYITPLRALNRSGRSQE
jgi:hypothetical protein